MCESVHVFPYRSQDHHTFEAELTHTLALLAEAVQNLPSNCQLLVTDRTAEDGPQSHRMHILQQWLPLVLYLSGNDTNTHPYITKPLSAGVCAFAMSGFDVTQHLFYGFLPHKGTQRKKCLEEALFNGFVTIIYESPHRILKFFEEVSQIAADRQIFAVREMTKKFETRYKGDAQSIYNHVKTEITKGEWVIVVDAGERKNHQDMTFEEISLSHLSMKDKAKELAKTTGKSPKECYALLQKHYG